MSEKQVRLGGRLNKVSKKLSRYLLFFNILIMFAALSSIVVIAVAQGGTAALSGGKFIGAGIAVAGSTIGAGIALSGTASSGLAAVVEKPGMATWLLLIAGLSEGIAIYGLIISIIILGS